MTALTESTFEDAALGRLETNDWRIARRPAIVRGMPASGSRDYGEVALAQRLRDGLLPKLISGEMRVKDAEPFVGSVM